MNSIVENSRGATWLRLLTNAAPLCSGYPDSVRVVDAPFAGAQARFLSVVPDPQNPYPRVRNGEIGLLEGWQLARAVSEVIDADQDRDIKRPIIAIIDVRSQAYGLREEAYGIHQALAGAAASYANARLVGHPVIGLIVGSAMSGAFLAHGYQANRLIALDDPKVMVHAMGKESAARITMRSVDDLQSITAGVAPMAYDIASYASLGLLWDLIKPADADNPTSADVDAVQGALMAAYNDIVSSEDRSLSDRLHGAERAASKKVRAMLRANWTL